MDPASLLHLAPDNIPDTGATTVPVSLLLLTFLCCMLFQALQEALWQVRPVCLGVEVVLNVVAIVECDGIIRTGHAIIRDGIGTARPFWIDEDVLAPAHKRLLVEAIGAHGTHALRFQDYKGKTSSPKE